MFENLEIPETLDSTFLNFLEHGKFLEIPEIQKIPENIKIMEIQEILKLQGILLLMENSSQQHEIRTKLICKCVLSCTHYGTTTPLPRCSMLACVHMTWRCGIYAVRAPSRSVPSYYVNIECEGGAGVLHQMCFTSDCMSAVANLFPSTVPLHMAMRCITTWTHDRYVWPYNIEDNRVPSFFAF